MNIHIQYILIYISEALISSSMFQLPKTYCSTEKYPKQQMKKQKQTSKHPPKLL